MLSRQCNRWVLMTPIVQPLLLLVVAIIWKEEPLVLEVVLILVVHSVAYGRNGEHCENLEMK